MPQFTAPTTNVPVSPPVPLGAPLQSPKPQPTKQANRSLFSLSLEDLDTEIEQLTPPQPDRPEPEPEGPPVDPQRLPALQAFLRSLPELTERQSLNAVIQHRRIEVQGANLCFVLANDFEWRLVEAERLWLTDMIREFLNHPSLKLTYRVDSDLQAAEEERIRQQSPEYRAAKMIAKNPNLRTLIERMGLQPE